MSKQPISSEFPFESRYVDVHGAKMHYVDEGEGDPILLLHGNISHSYVWRNIIPHLSKVGRCIAPDNIGLGRSDAPDLTYNFADHVRFIEGFIERMNLKNITFVGHDFGSALSCHYATRHQANVKGLAMMEWVFYPLKSWDSFTPEMWRAPIRSFRTPEGRARAIKEFTFIDVVLDTAQTRRLTPEERRQWKSPYEDLKKREVMCLFTTQVPVGGDPPAMVELVRTYFEKLKSWDVPKLHLYSTPGGISVPRAVEFGKTSFTNLEMVHLGPSVHYLQEDYPHEIGDQIAQWYRKRLVA